MTYDDYKLSPPTPIGDLSPCKKCGELTEDNYCSLTCLYEDYED